MVQPSLHPDAWLTEKLGKPAFHLGGDLAELPSVHAQISGRLAGSLFADAKVAVDDAAAAAAVQRLGFTLIDTNLRFALPRSQAPAGRSDEVAFASADMAGAVGEIAAACFVNDRFHRDPQIPDDVVNELKRSWATNFFSGRRGNWMVVALRAARPIGFLQLLRAADGALVIDLIAVMAGERGRGLAQAMIAFACANCDCSGPVIVGTQVANVGSVRLYERLGFRLATAQYVFHHHGA